MDITALSGILKKNDKRLLFGILFLSAAFWTFIYLSLQSISKFIITDVFLLEPGRNLTQALGFFIYEVPKVFLLLVLIIFIVGIIRSYFSPEKTRKALEGKKLFTGNVMASLLGIVTPFCSCSAVPLFLGFVEAGVPLGVTFSFLISAPMINEIAVILLLGLFGWKVTLIYISTGLVIAIISGWIIGKLHLEKYIEGWVFKSKSGYSNYIPGKTEFIDRIKSGLFSVKEIVLKIWIYLTAGIAIGAGIHGYVPQNYMTGVMENSAWYSVPFSILIGVPLYSNAAGIIPIVQALLEKGIPLGTSLAFMMSVIGLSLPETIILKKVLKLPLILIFVGIVAAGIMCVGFIFNIIV